MDTPVGRMSIRSRIWGIVAVFLLALFTMSYFNADTIGTTMMSEKRLKTRHLVEAAHTVIKHFHGLQQSGALDEAAAKAAAIATLKSMRYDEKEYFWVHEATGAMPKMIMHPTVPALDGKPLDSPKFNSATSIQAGLDGAVQKVDKLNLFVAFNKAVEQMGHGYVTYDWAKPLPGGGVTTEFYEKLSYVKRFDSWAWVVGSGIYIDDVQEAKRKVELKNYITVAAVGALLIVIASLLAKSITQPLFQTIEAMRDISHGEGDLTKRLHVSGANEIKELADCFNQFASKIQSAISQVAQSATRLQTLTSTLQSVANHTSQSVEKQIGEADQVAQSVQGLVSRAAEINQGAENAAAAASAADQEANAGQGVVSQTISSINTVAEEVVRATDVIHDLEKDSHDIGAILETIKGIADQTNLLALNAAIEAARAGEQGRGFAVVADEVRKLAQSTQDATSQIQAMITKLQGKAVDAARVMEAGRSKVENSVNQAQRAGESLEKITHAVATISDMNTQIAMNAMMQNVETDQIGSSISSIDEMADQTAADMKHTEAAVIELAASVNQLQGLISQFRIN